ncbi:MAG: methyltransferase domain-containing protein [Planctomycetota bacterium]
MQKELKIFACPKTHDKIASIFSHFTRGKTIDLGAGGGALSRRLSQLGFEVEACDTSGDNFGATEIPLTICNLNKPLPYQDESFDYALAVQVVEHLEHQFGFIREAGRILKKGGRFLVSTPNILSLPSRLRYLLTGSYSLFPKPLNELKKNPAHDHITATSYQRLRYLLHTNGFKIIKIAADRIRKSACFLLPLYPVLYLGTLYSLSAEKDEMQQTANKEIKRHLLSPALLLSRSLIVVAEKI